VEKMEEIKSELAGAHSSSSAENVQLRVGFVI